MQRRQPNAQVFDLGHYEQMQIALAIEEARVANEDLEPEERAVDLDTLNGLRWIFEEVGTLSIVRNTEES